MFPIMAGNSASTGYNLTRSLRFRASATPWLNRTLSAGNQKTWTLSAWVKRGTLGAGQVLFDTGVLSTSDSTFARLGFDSSNCLNFTAYTVSWRTTTQVFRDPSAWYHIVLAFDTTQATAANRVKIYVNGVQVTAFSTSADPTLNTNYAINQAAAHYFGYPAYSYGYFDGYLTEVNFIDGQALTPSSFGSTNALTGVWQPARYTGTYGTNGFYLPFTDNSSLTTSSNVGLGKDFSGNGNYWTTNNISITAGVTYDSMTDVPTLTSATAANFAVLNPLDVSGTLTNANLYLASGSGVRGTMAIPTSSNKVYFEATNVTANDSGGSIQCGIGIATSAANLAGGLNGVAGIWGCLWAVSRRYVSANGSSTAVIMGDIAASSTMQMAVDLTTGNAWVGLNNTWYDSSAGTTGNPSTGANPTFTGLSGNLFPYLSVTSNTSYANFGQRPFTYTPPTGYVALNTYNLPTSTILQGNKVMDATLWTGNGATRSIVNAAGFQPDLVWSKARSAAISHLAYDSVRGATKYLQVNLTSAEGTGADSLTAFNSNGFSLGADTSTTGVNQNGTTYVGWQWQAGQGSTSSNTNGTITSTVSVNASAGFSVVTYTGTGVNATIGHGLGVAPSLIIIKQRSAGATYWATYHASVGNTSVLYLNDTGAAFASSVYWNNTSPTSSVFTTGISSYQNTLASTYVAYCWTPIAGYSAFGSYTGNGSADGTFVYTGFRPRWIMAKQSSAAGQSWNIFDTARNTYNLANTTLYADQSSAEDSVSNAYDILSNGFKLRTSASQGNTNGATYIYMAFAENPFKNSLAR